MDDWGSGDMAHVREFAAAQGLRYELANGFAYMVWDKRGFEQRHPEGPEMPDVFAGRSFASFSVDAYSPQNIAVARAALRTAERYARDFGAILRDFGGGGLYFVSATKGSGKTHLACAVGHALVRQGVRVRYQNMLGLLDELKASFDRERGTSAAAIKDAVIHAQALILDDIGVEQQKPWIDELLYAVLDARNLHGRPTIFTSNLPIGALKCDERVRARIEKMAMVVALPEESIRRKLARVSHDRMRAFLEGGAGGD